MAGPRFGPQAVATKAKPAQLSRLPGRDEQEPTRETRSRSGPNGSPDSNQLEADLGAIESEFSNPGPETNWEEAHRRHAEIKKTLDDLYNQLAELSELLG
jgi:hypothetical protein